MKTITKLIGLISLFLSGYIYATIDIPHGPTGLAAKFAINKTLCGGDPATHPNIADCELEPIVAKDAPVFYLFSVTNPWGEPQQLVQLNDTYPSSFSPSGPVSCQDSNGSQVSIISGTSASTIAIFTLDIAETVHCTVPGTFTSNGQITNSVTGTNNDDYSINSSVNTAVIGTKASGVDLEVIKTAAVPVLDISSGAVIQEYTIDINNNSNQNLDAGAYFKLHDKLSLLPNSVPFRANLVSSACNSTPGTDCLSQPFEYGNNQILVGTMAPHNFLRWEFPAGNGTIAANGQITIKFRVRFEKLEGLDCIVAPNADGIRNKVFFTLIGSTEALSESNPANNISHADTKLTTGNTTVDPFCGKGHLKVTKEQLGPSNPVTWGDNVGYKITIKNQSLPAQDITIDARSIQDWITQGVNTPPFTRYHLDTDCLSSTDSDVCDTLELSFDNINQTGYHYYGQTEKAWDSGINGKVILKHGHEIIIGTEMKFREPDCETTPAAPRKPIINTAIVNYQATAYGALSVNNPQIAFTQSASATTLMRNNPPCKFTVSKEADGKQLEFGVPSSYRVTFRSDEPDRKIGTVADLIRLSTSTYASSLSFTSQWTCSDNGLVSGYQASGSNSGTVNFTSTPAQGFPAVELRSVPQNRIFFQQGGEINCKVDLIVKRPPYGSALCESDPVRLQNLALMDVTYPFNNNIHWPPAGGYDANDWQRPSTQNKNWAMADKLMPKCIDAILNKEAEVSGLPNGSAAWTKENGPDVNFRVTLTNTAQGPLASLGSSWPFNGVMIEDDFNPPYANGSRANESCSNGSISGNTNWCSESTINPIRQLGITNLAENENGTWTYTHDAPFISGEDMTNCAALNPNGQMNPANNGAYYTNFKTPVMRTDDNSIQQSDCVTVPVIRTTHINITKQIEDNTGGGVTTTTNPFEFTVSCSPFNLFTGTETVNVNAGSTGTIVDVPVRSDCTITETDKAPVPQAAQNACAAQGMMAAWGGYTYSPTNPITSQTLMASSSANPASVTITNALKCVEANWGSINVTKHLEIPNDLVKTMPELEYKVNISCTPGPANPSSAIFTLAGGSSAVEKIQAPEGAECIFTEITPSFPQELIDYCKTKRLNRRGPAIYGTPKWEKTFIPSDRVTIGKTPRIQVRNKFVCGLTDVIYKDPGNIGRVPVGTTGTTTNSGNTSNNTIIDITQIDVTSGTTTETRKTPVLIGTSNSALLKVNAGKDKAGVVGKKTNLDGSKSYDSSPNAQLKYLWKQLSGPDVTLENAQDKMASFTPKKSGVYIFNLTVTNAQGQSKTDQVKIGVVDLKSLDKKRKWKIPFID